VVESAQAVTLAPRSEIIHVIPRVYTVDQQRGIRDPLGMTGFRLEVEAHLVSGKRAHDYAEVFDGVPSQHDGKDAAVVAELCALGKSLAWPWPAPDEQVGELMFLVDQLEAATREKTVWVLRLEAMLARHWPEASRVLKPGGGTMLRALAHYGGPAALAADPQAAATLQRWGTRWLDADKVRRVVASARSTAGVRQGATDLARVQWCATKALEAHREAGRCQAKLKRLGYTGPRELLAEKFHMDEDFLAELDPFGERNGADLIEADGEPGVGAANQ